MKNNLLISLFDSFFRTHICLVTLFILAKYGNGNEIYYWAVGIIGIIWSLIPLIQFAFEDRDLYNFWLNSNHKV